MFVCMSVCIHACMFVRVVAVTAVVPARKGVSLPIVGITGCALESDTRSFRDAGLNELLVKPVPREDVLRILRLYHLI